MNQHQFGESDDSEEILVSAENGMSYRQVQDKQRQFNIHQIITKKVGTWVKVLDREAIKVWDGVVWLEFPFALVVELGLLPHNLSETFNEEEIAWLVEVHTERQDEVERLALRQLLAETHNKEQKLS